IEIETQSSGGMPLFEIPGRPGAQRGAISIGDIFGKLGGRTKTRRLTVEGSHEILVNEESDKLLDNDQLVQEAIGAVENNGIVFLDEIDKICVRDGRVGGDVSREGVQRDLLPLIEGTTVSTKHVAVAVKAAVENTGPRRLQTVMERGLDDISVNAPDRNGETVQIDADYVQKHVGDLARNADLSRFIL